MNSLSFVPRAELPDCLSRIWKVMKHDGIARLTVRDGTRDAVLACFGLMEYQVPYILYTRDQFKDLLGQAGFTCRMHEMRHDSHHFTVTKD